jgi:hypothetical protein
VSSNPVASNLTLKSNSNQGFNSIPGPASNANNPNSLIKPDGVIKKD